MSASDAPVPPLTRLDLGHYEASRAGALSGVPERALYQWAGVGLVVPPVSVTRQNLWSYGDLLTLRLVRWLRAPEADLETARTKIGEIRHALEKLGPDLWAVEADGLASSTILVTRSGDIVLDRPPRQDVDGQALLDIVDLFAPFERGPDLRRPRPHLRIIPGKVAGEPHLAGSRLTTRAVAALAARGLPFDDIAALYPHEEPDGLREALDLEAQLAA
ncbi:MAG TPA: DUF433 domain-containing protein [Egibacteraceae bacterium]|nr:DUF433 domain-containing protein [Egibacteraceae bacterium]